MAEASKIIVLGGAGDMGSRAVEDLARSPGIEEVAIADRNTPVAEALAARLKDAHARVTVRTVDALNHQELVRTLHGFDVAASALGPFYLFEEKLARAAIEAGVNYASICDEADAAETVFRNLDGEARAKGRIILTGLGASPGLSNVGIRLLSKNFDRLTRADIYVYQPLDAGGGEAVLRHMLHIMSGHVVTWRGGKSISVRACSESRSIEFPKFGSIRLWNMGHSEPFTIPRSFPKIEEVNFLMGFGKGARMLVWPAKWGVFAGTRRTNWAIKILTKLDQKEPGKEPGVGAVRIDVWGIRNGRDEHRMLCGVGHMREATGLSLSVGALMLLRKETTCAGGGVFAPEACIDPIKFMEHLRAKGLEAFEDLALTRPLV